MRVLVACEESQAVCIAFRNRGHEAYSCDIQECSGGHPEWHIQGDCLPLIDGNCEFRTVDGQKHIVPGQWDLLIAHPPCTYLTVTGNRWFNVLRYGDKARERERERAEAADFFMRFVNANCKHIAIENPIGCMSRFYRKPNQIIQPYWFGETVRKSTCLWLKNLPKLKPTKIVEPEIEECYGITGKSTYSVFHNVRDENGKLISWTDPRVAKERSKTLKGVAEAIATQWGDCTGYFEEEYEQESFL